MLLWLEEAVVEAAMVLAVAVGSILFVLATWSFIADWLHREKSGGGGAETTASSDEAGPSSRPGRLGMTRERRPA